MILIGSRALAFRAPQLLNRQPKDFDFIATEDEAVTWLQNRKIEFTQDGNKIIAGTHVPPCEFELICPGTSSQMLEELVEKDPQTLRTKFGMVPNVNLLFTLKASHRYLKNSPHFWKTARDYHCLKLAGAKILPEYLEFFKLREQETYNYKHPNLNVKKTDFFNGDQVEYVYDHDTIHLAMAVGSEPAYKSFQKDGSEVACDKAKFFAAPEEIRVNSVLEESYVLALERSQIPFAGKLTPRQSFLMALSKVCSSITSGWWREFAYEHIFEAIKRYDDTYVERFRRAVAEGVVKKL
jgi:hypothetical protein